MVTSILSGVSPWAFERLTLLINHVLSSEPVAGDKLRPHAGRVLQVTWVAGPGVRLPAWLDAPLGLQGGLPPALLWRVTPAGLLEWQPPAPAAPLMDTAPALRLTVTLPPPWTAAWRALRGERPEVAIEGDAQFAEAAAWLVKNLRWDIEDDLARALGGAPTELLRSTAEAVRDALLRGWQSVRTTHRTGGSSH